MASLSTAYKLGFQISPIILTDGVASLIPGGMLPIVAITQAAGFTTGLLNGSDATNLDDYFAHFEPAPGTMLLRQTVGSYPFANQAVAANATIQQELPISLLMHCPARGPGGYAAKLLTMGALIAVLNKHNTSGGSYVVATPSAIFTGCLMLGITDVGAASGTFQRQTTFQWDFQKPLISAAQAQQTLNALMGKLESGVATDMSWSGLAANVGGSLSNLGSSVMDSLTGMIGSLSSEAQGIANTLAGGTNP